MKKISLTRIGIGFSLATLASLSLVPVAFAEPYGWTPQVDFSNQGPPKCTDPKPDKAPILLQPNHPALPKKPKKGEVVLYWHKVPGSSGYNVYYGLSSKNYIYTAPDIGNTDNFTVRGLANRTYYFAVQAKKGCAASSLSKEWPGRAGGGGVSLAATGFTPVKKTTTGAPTVTSGTTTSKISTPSPTKSTSVQGAAATAQPTTVQAPRTQTTTPRTPTAVPTPKPSSWWQTLLRWLGLSR